MYFLIIVGTNKGGRGNCVFVRRVLYWKWPQNIAIMRIFKKDSSIPKIPFPISKSEVRTCQKSCWIGDGKDDRHNQRTNVYMSSVFITAHKSKGFPIFWNQKIPRQKCAVPSSANLTECFLLKRYYWKGLKTHNGQLQHLGVSK